MCIFFKTKMDKMKVRKEDIKQGHFFHFGGLALPMDVCCVYKIRFSGGFFYIGHTKCLKSRLATHRAKPKDGKVLYVEIMHVCKTPIHANELEVIEVEKELDNKFILNKVRPTLRT